MTQTRPFVIRNPQMKRNVQSKLVEEAKKDFTQAPSRDVKKLNERNECEVASRKEADEDMQRQRKRRRPERDEGRVGEQMSGLLTDTRNRR